MVKLFIPITGIMIMMSSCTALKSLHLSGNKKESFEAAPVSQAPTKFINDIAVTTTPVEKAEVRSGPQQPQPPTVSKYTVTEEVPVKQEIRAQDMPAPVYTTDIEEANSLQLKYSILLNTEVEYLPSRSLLEAVDDWYGVRYHLGGTSKRGVDCTGFTCAVFSTAYGISLPRVSKDQFKMARKISTTELQEGDLVFFNMHGRGVSHVGIYLGNNCFIHASVSKGVMVSSLFDSYYLQHFAGAGRIDDKQVVTGY